MQGHSLTCTFCRRSEHEVRKLVAGPGVYICDACVEIAHRIVSDDGPVAGEPVREGRLARWLRAALGGVGIRQRSASHTRRSAPHGSDSSTASCPSTIVARFASS
jgi:hypothetical protein